MNNSKPGREVRWEDGVSTDDGGWVETETPSHLDMGPDHDSTFTPRFVPLVGFRTWTKKKKVQKQSHSSSDSTTSYGSGDKEEMGSCKKDTTSTSASPVSGGSGGGKDAGSSGKETAPRSICPVEEDEDGWIITSSKKTTPPSASPVADGSGGGEEVGAPAQKKPTPRPRPRTKRDREEAEQKRKTPGTRLWEADNDSLRKWEEEKAGDQRAKARIKYGNPEKDMVVTRSMTAPQSESYPKGCPLE